MRVAGSINGLPVEVGRGIRVCNLELAPFLFLGPMLESKISFRLATDLVRLLSCPLESGRQDI